MRTAFRWIIKGVDMNRLVEEMGNIFEVSVSKKMSLQYSLADSLPAVDADATQIRQVVMNLVISASEAIGEEIPYMFSTISKAIHDLNLA